MASASSLHKEFAALQQSSLIPTLSPHSIFFVRARGEPGNKANNKVYQYVPWSLCYYVADLYFASYMPSPFCGQCALAKNWIYLLLLLDVSDKLFEVGKS